ncbi:MULTISPECIES: phage holin family protein [unclassified Dysgonomonas]|uniref:phage holin family protein n=1 Tax=unclassified Dysgonomonas TaxID=2630389 RepID=UPI00067FCB32|nr:MULTISPECIES: phage holin family protein [unclassified Dysgonomonas]MBD8347714.1 phage holin family protein [Dysgonomonas sp. HGC4]MBF0577342.1 phage holin family protein [Dysgonomonas sp. GY617]
MKSNNEEYQNFSELIDESKADLSSYIEKRLTLAKLKAFEKISSASSYIIYGLMMSVFALILFILVLVGLGFVIGDLLNNYAAGFGVLILITLVALFALILNAKKIRRFFLNTTLRTIKKIESDED